MRLYLNRPEKDQLTRLAQESKDARLRRRAQALLDIDAGEHPRVVAQRYEVARSTIYNWITRCHTRGFSDEALGDLPRPGRPPRLRPNHGSNGEQDAV